MDLFEPIAGYATLSKYVQKLIQQQRLNEVFKRLQSLKITSHEESIRRGLRTGKLKGYQRSKK